MIEQIYPAEKSTKGKGETGNGKDLLVLRKAIFFLALSLFPCIFFLPVHAASGTGGAAFLDIPVGGGPAAMGSAYTALSNDAYAATWNPGGLAFLDSSQFSGQHLSYI